MKDKTELTSIATPPLTTAAETLLRLPELLAPAGDWECARAAVENGADAIYFGLEKFNARMRAQNFSQEDLPKLMEFLHRRGVKGYVTFNTLVFENEMAAAEQYLRVIIASGVDAAIVQDVGICHLIRRLSPDFPIHVSTQMTVTSAAGVAFARELGCQLVVLARECSLKEIEKITNAPGAATLLLEVFVHGALCVAYSGQCLTSESLGGRSANRGVCAQACRLPYELISDGQPVPLGDRKYLLSPQDLAGLPVLSDLVRLGVTSLKIEGRLKSPEYVANITRIYREALDDLGSSASPGHDQAASQYEMEMAFSRGLYTGWFGGTNNQELVHARFGKKRGVYLGEVSAIEGRSIRLKLHAPLKPGDGVVFDAGKPEEPEEGGRVYRIDRRGPDALLTFGSGDIDLARIHQGDKLWKTSDPELERRLRQSFAGEIPKYHRPLCMQISGAAGRPFRLVVRDEAGQEVRLESTMPLLAADKQPFTTERLKAQLGRLGGTSFELDELTNSLEGDVLLPVSELNRLRRAAVQELEAMRVRPLRWTLNSARAGEEILPVFEKTSAKNPKTIPELLVLVRSLPQLQTAMECGVRTVYCEFEDPKKYREAVQLFRAQKNIDPAEGDRAIFVAPPRVFKMGEDWILKQVRSCEADGYLVRNYDHLQFFSTDRCIGDYSLNVANRLSADCFKNKFRLERLTASYDLNFEQLEALLHAVPADWLEITIHQHIPMFHMEHCVFCAFLSKGTDYTNCGRPCDRHDVQLRDRVGARHPLKADAGCRNTVFNALAQTGADYVSRLLTLGARHFRVEFLNETPEQMTRTIQRYGQLLRGEITGADLWRELKLLNQLGVTRGQIGSTT